MPIANKIREQFKKKNWIREMSKIGSVLKIQHGEKNVFDLSIGNPEIEPPPEVLTELRKLVQVESKGMHRYMERFGYEQTRQAVAETLAKEYGLPYTRNDVVMTSGASSSICIVLKSMLNPNDEVIVLAPFFSPYLSFVENAIGVPIVVNTTTDFQLDLNAIEAAITPNTACLIINSPNNPSGAVYRAEDLEALAALLYRKQKELNKVLTVMSDEVYRKIVYDGLECPQMSSFYENTVIVSSYSKDLCIPGERIGYVALHPHFHEKQEFLIAIEYSMQVSGIVNAPALMQRLIANLQDVSVDVLIYQKKRDFLYNSLVRLGYKTIKPQGAIFLMIKSPFEEEMDFVRALICKNVLVVPGTAFGVPGYVRLAFSVEDWVLEGSVREFNAIAKDNFRCANNEKEKK